MVCACVVLQLYWLLIWSTTGIYWNQFDRLYGYLDIPRHALNRLV